MSNSDLLYTQTIVCLVGAFVVWTTGAPWYVTAVMVALGWFIFWCATKIEKRGER